METVCISTATVATNDKVLIHDAGSGDVLRTVTAQSIANLAGGADGDGIFTSGNDGSTVSTNFNVELTDKMIFNQSISNGIVIDGANARLGVMTASPTEALHVTGAAIITSRTGTATNLGGWDAGNKAVNVTVGGGLDLTSGTLQTETATTSNEGTIELATEAEALAGTATNMALTPDAIYALIPVVTDETISGSTKTLDCDNKYSNVFDITNSGNNDCTLTINNERDGATYVFHFHGMTAEVDITFPTDYKKADASTNLGTITASSDIFVTCYDTGSQLNCSVVTDQ
jgi:hypothetical protein